MPSQVHPLRRDAGLGAPSPRKSLSAIVRTVFSSSDFARRVAVGTIGTVALAPLGAQAAVAGLLISQLLDGVVKELVDEQRLSRRKLWLVTLLLCLYDAGRKVASAATGRRAAARDSEPRSLPPASGAVRFQRFAVTAVAASATVVGAFTFPELAAGGSLWERPTTFLDNHGTETAAVDRTPPTLTLPANLRVEAAHATPVRYSVAARDEVSGALAANCRPRSGAVFPLGATTVHCSVSDAAGNVAHGRFTVTLVKSSLNVTFAYPKRLEQAAANGDGAVASFTVSATTAAGDPVVVRCDPPSGSLFPLGETPVTCRAAGRQVTLIVAVTDQQPPRLTVPSDFTLTASSGTGQAVDYQASASDDVDGSVPPHCTPSSGAVFGLGTTPVTCTAEDASGNHATAHFTVTLTSASGDRTPPTLTLKDATAEATSPSGAAVSFEARASDERDGDLRVSCEPRSGATFPLGTTIVRCSATDQSGNTAKETLQIVVTDTTKPTLTLPQSRPVEATSADGATVDYTATASDRADSEVAARCTPASGAVFGFGATTVRCSATDNHGNRAEGSFTVTVADTIAPLLRLPAGGVFRAEATSSAGAVVSYAGAVGASDAVDGAVALSCKPASGSRFPLGTTPVSCTARDTHENARSGAFGITVADTTPPTVTPPPPITLEASGPGGAVYSGPSITVRGVDTVDGVLTGSCPIRVRTTFPLGTTTITCSLIDHAGNTGKAALRITVTDTKPPRLTLPPTTLTIWEAGYNAGYGVLAFGDAVTAYDTVDGAITPVCNPPAGTHLPNGSTTTVNCTATDRHGNTTRGSLRVYIQAGID